MGHKILLADDSITIQKVIELTFSDEDFELHTVGNGQKAIEEIRTIQPDIVLCDIIMPEKNGYEVCEYIKSNPETKHIPVLLLTGAFEPFDQERAKAAGCEGFLAKPFEPQTLISKVKELLANASGAPQAVPSQAAAPPAADAVTTQSAAPVEPVEPAADETVLVPPPAAAPTPPPIAGPQVPATPNPPPPPQAAPEMPGLDVGFAVEAGERELAMDPGDHTMLLGANDAPEAPMPPATPPGASDDIWSDVTAAPPTPQAPPAPEVEPVPPVPAPPAMPMMEDDQDSATVFMAPPMDAGSGDTDLAPPPPPAPVDNEMEVASSDPDATWQMPAETPETPPPAPPSDELGGFEDFAAAAAPAPPPPSAPPSSQEVQNDAGPSDAFAPDAPTLESAPEGGFPPVTPEPIPSVDTQATLDPVAAGVDAFPPITPPPADETPKVVETPSVVDEASPAPEPETPFTPLESSGEPAPAEPLSPEPPPSAEPLENVPPVALVENEPEPFMPLSEVASPSEPSPEPPSPPAAGGGGVAVDDDLVERVAQRVVDKLSEKVIQEIAWEVVPDLAEGLIQKEIDALKSKIPKTG